MLLKVFVFQKTLSLELSQQKFHPDPDFQVQDTFDWNLI